MREAAPEEGLEIIWELGASSITRIHCDVGCRGRIKLHVRPLKLKPLGITNDLLPAMASNHADDVRESCLPATETES